MGAAMTRSCKMLGLLSYATLSTAASECVAHANGLPPPAYNIAAQRSGIPPDILFAVALQESGISIRGQRLPWPWTLNIAGRAHYFASYNEACLSLRTALVMHPAFRIDAGLTQINLGHQRRFYREPCELLHPRKNLAVAATLLSEQHRSGEDWLTAAGRFHRPTGGPLATRYQRLVRRHLDKLKQPEGNRP
jgi:hypothetical protein